MFHHHRARLWAVVTAVTMSVSMAHAEPASHSVAGTERPPTGTGQIIAGWILSGVGAVNLAALPVCSADFYPAEATDSCKVLSLVFAGAGLGVGIPLLLVGYGNRAEHKRWRERHKITAHLLRTQLSFGRDTITLSYRGEL